MNKKEYHIWYNQNHKIQININRKIWYQKHKKDIHDYNVAYNRAHKSKMAKHYQDNKEEISNYNKVRYIKKRSEIIERTTKYNKQNADKISKYLVEYRKRNAKKRAAYNEAWKKRNPDLVSLSNLKFHYKRSKRIKKNLSEKETIAIKAFYRNCPTGCVVDHIVPLLGKTTKGWHELKNLQYLAIKENMKKGNKFPYYPLDFYRKKGLT